MVVVVDGGAVTVVEDAEWLRILGGCPSDKELERWAGRDEPQAPAAPARASNAATIQAILLGAQREAGFSIPVRVTSMLADVIGRRQMTADRAVAWRPVRPPRTHLRCHQNGQ